MCFVERKTHRESWKGEESVKERFILPEDKMVPFLDGESCSRSWTFLASHQSLPPYTPAPFSPSPRPP